MMAAVTAKAWKTPMPGPCDVDREAAWFRKAMTQICDIAMPRIWAPLLKEVCRRRHTEAEAATLYGAYKEVKKSLQQAIRRAKSGAWEELLEILDDDPWGRPYMIVRKKLQSGGPPTTESLHPQVLEDVVSALFPVVGDGCGDPPGQAIQPQEWTSELGVTEEELARAIKRLGAKNTAPGSDGIPGFWPMVSSGTGSDGCLQPV
ncbi:reverse transcriptase [Lasius niger]|uniref:Reverse transcriptase n=1 Tax=Lasius niger TaxID=67767 RepID=A0A0J7N9K6_LASNI|nr:reverse transcriptase [Lasius niger]